MDTKAARGNEKRENGGKDRTNLWRDSQRGFEQGKKKKLRSALFPW